MDVRHENSIAWVTVNNPPVNATSTAVRQALLDAVKRVQGAQRAILHCMGKTFIAGGDMTEFDAPPKEPHLPEVVNAIEASKTPFIAAMHGHVLGAGLEIAMACAYRIAVPGTMFGLPEVNVGLIPGAGGSQRAPRLFGWDAAFDMACLGKLLTAEDALKRGAIDALENDILATAQAFTLGAPIRVSDRSVDMPTREWIADKGKILENRSRGQASPSHNLSALLWAGEPFAVGQKKERALHLSLRQSDESRALRHAFFAERTVSQPAQIADVTPKDVARIAVVGGGLMGAGIAAACLNAGFKVAIVERHQDGVMAAKDRVFRLLEDALRRGKIDQSAHNAQIAACTIGVGYALAKDADLAIEAVFEDEPLKRQVFHHLAAIMRKDAILATNTSYLDPRVIFDGIENPARCIALHFFSPAHIMKLLEIAACPKTSQETLVTGFTFAKRLRKVAVLSGICQGFIGNRMLAAYRRAAEYMLADGAYPQQIDEAMRGFGMAMGPFEAQDMAGLQIAQANRRRQDATRPAGERYVTLSDTLCGLGRTGQAVGKGWYAYEKGKKTPIVDPNVTRLITTYWQENNISPVVFTVEQIQNQLLAILVNEGARIVEEGIAQDDSVIDMVKIHGYGFPRWRGGPMFAAHTAGIAQINLSLNQLEVQSPGTWVRAQRFS